MSRSNLFKLVVAGLLFAVGATIYFSSEYGKHRAFAAMRESGRLDLNVIDDYIRSVEEPGPDYYDALNLAALVDDTYLERVIRLYASAQILLDRRVADRIMRLAPTDSLDLCTAVGRITATSQFGYEDLARAIELLEYSALRGDLHAARYLADVYRRTGCEVGQVTWSQIVNEREKRSACDTLAVDVNRLTDDQWSLVISNESSIREAWKRGGVPVVKYPPNCVSIRRDTAVKPRAPKGGSGGGSGGQGGGGG